MQTMLPVLQEHDGRVLKNVVNDLQQHVLMHATKDDARMQWRRICS